MQLLWQGPPLLTLQQIYNIRYLKATQKWNQDENNNSSDDSSHIRMINIFDNFQENNTKNKQISNGKI